MASIRSETALVHFTVYFIQNLEIFLIQSIEIVCCTLCHFILHLRCFWHNYALSPKILWRANANEINTKLFSRRNRTLWYKLIYWTSMNVVSDSRGLLWFLWGARRSGRSAWVLWCTVYSSELFERWLVFSSEAWGHHVENVAQILKEINKMVDSERNRLQGFYFLQILFVDTTVENVPWKRNQLCSSV